MGLVGQRGGVRSRAGHIDREAVVMADFQGFRLRQL